MGEVYDVMTDIARLAGCTLKEIGESKEWESIIKRAEAGRVSLCGTLEGETLSSALYGVYMLAFTEMKAVLKCRQKRKRQR
jgi:hypothetical protein